MVLVVKNKWSAIIPPILRFLQNEMNDQNNLIFELHNFNTRSIGELSWRYSIPLIESECVVLKNKRLPLSDYSKVQLPDDLLVRIRVLCITQEMGIYLKLKDFNLACSLPNSRFVF